MPFIPHTENDVRTMLEAIGVARIDDLFDEIPPALRIDELSAIPDALSECEMLRLLGKRLHQEQHSLNFIGAGAYEHHIPAAVWDITMRGEFLTAYTPYQAEASQGTLQLLYEYQTMIAKLTGMDVANASLYDGATAVAEATLMATRLQRHPETQIVLPTNIHPHYSTVARTIVSNQKIEIIEVPFSKAQGTIDLHALDQQLKPTAIVIQQPNFFGCLEDVDAITNWAHAQGALVIACVNPTTLALLKEPGQWGNNGADIVIGEGQPLGVPLACGGPYFGFLACKQANIRQMPGRLAGKTTDAQGHTGYTLTLQAREQHIRRGKATSNICTNQGLLVTAATIYLSLLGETGLKRVAQACHVNAHQLHDLLTAIPGVDSVFNTPFFHETVLRLNKPAADVLEQLRQQNIHGGYLLSQDYPELENCILVCATEVKTPEDLHAYADALAQCMR